MFAHYRTPGFILKKEDRAEADQLFTIYTKDFGKLEVLGKAIRKISSKLRSGMELFYLSEIEFIQGKTYKTLTDAILIEKFGNLRKDLLRLKIAYQISEVLDNLAKGQEKDENIWQLMREVFNRLNNRQSSIVNCQLLYYYFFWNLLSVLGYHPELYNCSLCQKKITPGKIYFNSREGGVICPNCFQKVKEKSAIEEINPDIVKILRIILKRDWAILSRLKIEPFHQKMLKTISTSFLSAVPHLK